MHICISVVHLSSHAHMNIHRSHTHHTNTRNVHTHTHTHTTCTHTHSRNKTRTRVHINTHTHTRALSLSRTPVMSPGCGRVSWSHIKTLTPVAGPIFQAKNERYFLESFFRERNYCPRTAFSGSNSSSILSNQVIS